MAILDQLLAWVEAHERLLSGLDREILERNGLNFADLRKDEEADAGRAAD